MLFLPDSRQIKHYSAQLDLPLNKFHVYEYKRLSSLI